MLLSIFHRVLGLLLSLLLLFGQISSVEAQEGQKREDGSGSQPEAVFLETGRPIERVLRGGENHSYLINLNAGQYLFAVVEQRGIDVVVSLFDIDGKKEVEIDSPNSTQGPEPLHYIAGVNGTYRLEVRSPSKGASPGRYEAKIEELRQAVAQDETRVNAQKALMEGRQLNAKGGLESIKKAIERYLEALSLYRAVEDRFGEVVTLSRLAVSHRSLDEVKEALSYYNQALPIYRSLGDRYGESLVLNNIGEIYGSSGDGQKALNYYSQALPIKQAIGDRYGEAYTLNSMGIVYSQFGEKQKAFDYYNQALSIRRSIKDRFGEAYTLHSIGNFYMFLDEAQKAFDYYNEAISLCRATNNLRIESSTLTDIGWLYASLREFDKAVENFNQALTISRSLNDRRFESYTLYYLGSVYNQIGDQQKALDCYSRCLSLARAVSDRYKEALGLFGMGLTYQLMFDRQNAIEYYNQALSIFGELKVRYWQAATIYYMASVERDEGRFNEARANIEKAIELIEFIRLGIASQELRASFIARAEDFYDFYIDLLMRMDDENPSLGYASEALKISEKARARSLIETLTEAHIDVRHGVDQELLEREKNLRRDLNDKAEALVKLLNRKHSQQEEESIQKDSEKLIEELQKVEAQIRRENPHYAALKYPEPLNLSQIQKQVLDENTLLLEYSLGKENSYVWAVSSSSISSFRLPKRDEIEALAHRVYQLLTAREKREFETKEEFLDRVKKADREYEEAAMELSHILTGPVAQQLGKKRLLIVADGMLQYLPFEALPVVKGSKSNSAIRRVRATIPMVANHEIVCLPSVSTLSVLREETAGRKPATKAIAMFANPVFSDQDERFRTEAGKVKQKREGLKEEPTDSVLNGLEPLPETEQMGRKIVALAPGKSRLATGFEANLEAATSRELSQYRIVHFATHGFLNPNPELSGIVLSLVNEEGEEESGFLSASAVYNLEMPVELVVLSACQTGLAIDPREEEKKELIEKQLLKVKSQGFSGLTRAFIFAGAERVLVSLWKIRVKATTELMERFYNNMLGSKKLSPAAALRQAQIEMWKQPQWRSPYYWAAFVISGEYR